MKFSVFKMVENFLQEKKFNHRRLAIFLCLAFVVALGTTAALKLTGIAKTRELTVLSCPVETHAHGDDCYDGNGTLICGHADFVVHTHTLDCYVDDVLTCKLPVIEAHTHDKNCYTREELLVCGHTADETDAVHVHTDACYTDPESEEPACGLSETDPANVHEHTDGCYTTHEALICKKEEIALHTHTVDCYAEAVFDENGVMMALTAQLADEDAIPETWTRDMVAACGSLQIEEHIHGAGCLETIELTPEEAEEYVEGLAGETQAEPDEGDNNDDEESILKQLSEIADITVNVQKKSGAAWVTAGAWEPFRPGDEIRIEMSYITLPGRLQPGDVVVYQFPEVLALEHDLSFPVTQNGVTVSTATVTTDGRAAFLVGNQIYPTVELEGAMTLTCRIKEDVKADGRSFPLPGTETVILLGKKQPTMQTSSDGHDLTVRKENKGFVPATDGSGRMTAAYTVTLRSEKGTGTPITISDFFPTQPMEGAALPEFGSITVTKDGKAVTEHGLYAENGEILGTLPELRKNESYTITYTVTVDLSDYDTQGGYLYLSNHIEADFADDGVAEDDSGAQVQAARLCKAGRFADGQFVWTIWVAADNKGEVLKDSPDAALQALIKTLSADAIPVTVDCSEGAAHSLTLNALLKGYKIDCDGAHTFTYATEPTLAPGESITCSNSAQVGGYTVTTDSILGLCDDWSGVKEGTDREAISVDGSETTKEQITWTVTINFPDDENWTDFVYTDSFHQTMTGWMLKEDGEAVLEIDHPVHHYQVRSKLDKELRDALWFWLEQADLDKALTYSFVYLDRDGAVVTDKNAEVTGFEIHFKREAGANLHGQSICFDYTTLLDTDVFADETDYVIENDFTLPGFTGKGAFSFRYEDQFADDESETRHIRVDKVWQDVKGNPLATGEIPGSVDIILKQYAFLGGIYLTEAPADSENWCALTLEIGQSTVKDPQDVQIVALNEELLGTNTATVWIPRHSQVVLTANDTTTEDGWSYSFNVKNVAICDLTLPAPEGTDTIYLRVNGDAPAGFVPAGDFTQYGEAVTLDGVYDNWSHTWEHLPLDDGGDTQYVYAVEELEVPDGYYVLIADDGAGVITVTNRRSMTPGRITVEMKWVDEEGYPLVTHPNSATVELQRKVPGTEDEWITVENSAKTLPNSRGAWTTSWTNLPDGEYRVVEKYIAGYAVSYTYITYDEEGNEYKNPLQLSGNAGFVTVTNIKMLAAEGDIIVVKVWEYEDGTPDTDHPESVIISVKRAKKAVDDSTETTAPEDDTTVPGDDTTVPVPDDTTVPGDDTTVPGDDTTVPDEETTEPSDETTGPDDTTGPAETTGPSDTTGPAPSDSSETNKTPTGDETHLLLYGVIVLISGTMLLAFLLVDRRRRCNARKEK